jgi:hypothetical protein
MRDSVMVQVVWCNIKNTPFSTRDKCNASLPQGLVHQTERQLAADEIQDRFFAGIIAELTAQLDDLLRYLITHATRTVLFYPSSK